MTGLSLINLY